MLRLQQQLVLTEPGCSGRTVLHLQQEKKQGSRWGMLSKGADASSSSGAASGGGSKLDAKALQSLGSMQDMNMDDLSAGMSKDVVLS
jgi:hypothetical protein